MASSNDPTQNNPFARSSQIGMSPEGDISRAYAVRRLMKQQAAIGQQTPGRVKPPARPAKAAY